MLVAFLIPLVTKGLALAIALMFIAWIIVPGKSLKRNKWPMLIFIALYLFHLLGMFFTEDVSRGLRDLEQKFSLLLFPVLFGTFPQWRPEHRRKVVRAFVLGCLFMLIVSFVESFLKLASGASMRAFYMSEFSRVHHPSYVAMYLNFAMAAILLGLFQAARLKKGLGMWWWLFPLMAATLVCPASKMGLLQFAFLALFFLFFAFRQNQLKSPALAILALSVVALSLSILSDPYTATRLTKAAEVVQSDGQPDHVRETETTVARLHTWNITWSIMKQHPFGVGTGDGHNTLMAAYDEAGLKMLAATGLNPHNNYLQVGLAFGFPGLLLFIFSLVYPFRKIIQHKDWLYAFFLLGMFMHLGVESMLEKQSGVVFFAFFNALLFFSLPQKEISPAEVHLKDTAQ